MPKQRYINTKLWNDNWIRTLNPLDRYLFIYLLTNEHTNIAGIYELPVGSMAYESGLDERDLQNAMLKRLEPKVYYIDGWVIICNFPKHQDYEKSPKIRAGIETCLKDIPDRVLKGIDTLSIPYTYPLNYYNTNSNTNTNYNYNTNSDRVYSKFIFRGLPCRKDNLTGKWKALDNGEWLEVDERFLKDIKENV